MALEPSKNPPITETGGGNNWLTGIVGALPSVISALFPSGVIAGNNKPVITTFPNGNSSVDMPAQNSSLIIIGLLALIGVLLLSKSSPKTI